MITVDFKRLLAAEGKVKVVAVRHRIDLGRGHDSLHERDGPKSEDSLLSLLPEATSADRATQAYKLDLTSVDLGEVPSMRLVMSTVLHSLPFPKYMSPRRY